MEAGADEDTSDDVGTGIAAGGYAVGDVLIGIENIIGSDGADLLTGDSRANVITGGEGNDMLTGGAGADTFVFGEQDDTHRDEILDFRAACKTPGGLGAGRSPQLSW